MKKILSVLLLMASVACSKNKPVCENWDIIEYCVPKLPHVTCIAPQSKTIEVCGEDLKDARAGKDKIRLDNELVTVTIRYIKKAG